MRSYAFMIERKTQYGTAPTFAHKKILLREKQHWQLLLFILAGYDMSGILQIQITNEKNSVADCPPATY